MYFIGTPCRYAHMRTNLTVAFASLVLGFLHLFYCTALCRIFRAAALFVRLFSTRDWLGRALLKLLVLCRVKHKTLT